MLTEHARVLVTGGGSGLGRACALAFARDGARLAVTDRNLQSAEATLDMIRADGGQGLALELDVTSEASFASAVERVVQEWGGVDVLINNAGVATSGTVEDSPMSQWQWVLDINLLGCVRGSRSVIPSMRKQGAGHIVNIASFAGIATPPAMASYNVAKAAVIALSETLRFELYPDIKVSVVCPAFFKTDLVNNSNCGALPEQDQSSAPQMMGIVERLMDKADITAEDVANDIFRAVKEGRFMVISHPDSRSQARLKRLSPEMFFRIAQKATAGFLRRDR